MPILKHAKKKLKQERKRELHNRGLKTAFKNLIKDANKTKTAEAVSKAFSAVDKAAKKNLIHENKAAHIKSALSKVVGGTATAKTTEKKAAAKKEVPAKKAQAKAPAKKTASKAAPKKSAKK